MKIHAVATDKIPLEIRAALATTDMRGVEHLIRAAKINIDRKMTVHEVDAKLKDTTLSPQSRIALKGALGRAGLMV
jgi:hypothetical protein